jgi:hypothetical protein
MNDFALWVFVHLTGFVPEPPLDFVTVRGLRLFVMYKSLDTTPK